VFASLRKKEGGEERLPGATGEKKSNREKFFSFS